MKKIDRLLNVFVRALLLPLFVICAQAQVIGPIYPAPGGTTFATSGSSQTTITATGRTNFYSGFDLAATDELWWTFTAIGNPNAIGQGITGNMAFSGFNATTGMSTWTSTANLITPLASGGSASTGTKFVMQFQPYTGAGNASLGAGWLTPTTAGTEGIPGLAAGQSVLDVQGNFQVWYQFQTASGVALADYFNPLPKIQGTQVFTSTSGGFYYTAIPEPSTYAALIGVATFGLTFLRKRQVTPI